MLAGTHKLSKQQKNNSGIAVQSVQKTTTEKQSHMLNN